MSSNSNLINAKIARNDEYYTRIDDIAAELEHYPDAFSDKSVILPCDLAEKSAFWTYFANSFIELGLTRLVAISRTDGNHGIMSTLKRRPDGGLLRYDVVLKGNGDMFSDEVKDIIEGCDIAVTNVPFSRFRDCVKLFMEKDIDFVIIGGKNGGKYQDTIGYIIDGKMRLGFNAGHGSMIFKTPDGKEVNIASYWFTTLMPDVHPSRKLSMTDTYAGHENDYPRYENYDAIEVSKIADIPSDYIGKMGVPITFLEYYDEDVWELLGTNATVLKDAEQDPEIKMHSHLYRRHNLYIKQRHGKYRYRRIYDRLIIRRKRI